MTVDATPLLVNQEIIADWRAKARAGIPLTDEELTASIQAYRKARSAAPSDKPKAKKVTNLDINSLFAPLS